MKTCSGNLRALLSLILAALTLTVTAAAAQLTPRQDLYLEEVEVTVPSQYQALVPPNLTVNLPVGFTATVFSAFGMLRPRLMAFSPDGVLHIADMRGDRTKDSRESRIMAFPDRDGDGVAGFDELTLAADGFSYANSLAFHDGDLFVAETHQVVRLRDRDGDLSYEERDVFIDDIPDIPSRGFHGTRTILFDEKGGKIYLTVGSPCDLCRQEQPLEGLTGRPMPFRPEWGTVLQFDLDGSHRRIFATGMRNVIGLDVHPRTGALWGTHNHYDLGGASAPPEWIDVLRDGGFYGYPFVYGDQQWVDFSPAPYQALLPITRQDSLLAQTYMPPAVEVPAHLAPMAIEFYEGDLFPASYQHAAFVALRGGRAPGNLAVVNGFKVVVLFEQPDGSFQAADFLTGFQKDGEVWAKPVGLATDAAGNLYVSSDHGAKAIFKISHNPLRAAWEHDLPDAIVSGATLRIRADITVERTAANLAAPHLRADLSGLGGSADVPLEQVGDTNYRLDTSLGVNVANGAGSLVIHIEQGPHRSQLVKQIIVIPMGDLVLLADGVGPTFNLDYSTRITADLASRVQVFDGATAAAFVVQPARLGGWTVALTPTEPVNPVGYDELRFAFHPGDMDPLDDGQFKLVIEGVKMGVSAGPGRHGLFEGYTHTFDLRGSGLGVDLGNKQWQEVIVPLAPLELTGPIAAIRMTGTVPGTFHLDDMRLVARSAPAATAVHERYTQSGPVKFSLSQNQPNPFNSNTVIQFELPVSSDIELAVFNMAGQQVADLARGQRPAGAYSLRWDGRDDAGRELASGVYVYRLHTDRHVVSRKLLLLR